MAARIISLFCPPIEAAVGANIGLVSGRGRKFPPCFRYSTARDSVASLVAHIVGLIPMHEKLSPGPNYVRVAPRTCVPRKGRYCWAPCSIELGEFAAAERTCSFHNPLTAWGNLQW